MHDQYTSEIEKRRIRKDGPDYQTLVDKIQSDLGIEGELLWTTTSGFIPEPHTQVIGMEAIRNKDALDSYEYEYLEEIDGVVIYLDRISKDEGCMGAGTEGAVNPRFSDRKKTEKSVGDSFPDGKGGYLYVSEGGWNWNIRPVHDDKWAVVFLNGGFTGGDEETMKVVDGLQNAMQTADMLGLLFDEAQKSKTENSNVQKSLHFENDRTYVMREPEGTVIRVINRDIDGCSIEYEILEGENAGKKVTSRCIYNAFANADMVKDDFVWGYSVAEVNKSKTKKSSEYLGLITYRTGKTALTRIFPDFESADKECNAISWDDSNVDKTEVFTIEELAEYFGFDADELRATCKSKTKKEMSIEDRFFIYQEKIADSEIMERIYDNDNESYRSLINALTDAEHYMDTGEYSYALECLNDFTRILDAINSDWDIELFDLDELDAIKLELMATEKTKKSKVKKGVIKFHEGMTVKEFFKENKASEDSVLGFDLYSMDLHGKQVATNYTGAKDYADYIVEAYQWDDLLGTALIGISITEPPVEKSKTEKSIDDILNGEDSFKYQMLSRWKSDMEYYFGHGKRRESNLWGGNFRNLIDNMVRVRDSLSEKPDWLTDHDIEDYVKYQAMPGWYRSNGQWTQNDEEFMYKSKKDMDIEELINAKRGFRPQ